MEYTITYDSPLWASAVPYPTARHCKDAMGLVRYVSKGAAMLNSSCVCIVSRTVNNAVDVFVAVGAHALGRQLV